MEILPNQPGAKKTITPKTMLLIALALVAIGALAFAGYKYSRRERAYTSLTPEQINEAAEKAAAEYAGSTIDDTASTPDTAAETEYDTGWGWFTSSGAGFKAYLPKNPVEEKGDNYYSYSVKDQYDARYMISMTQYSADVDLSNPQANLQGGLQGMLESASGSTLVSSEPTTFKGNPALDFVIRNGGYIMRGRILIVTAARTGYQIISVAPESDPYSPPNAEIFIKSFDLAK